MKRFHKDVFMPFTKEQLKGFWEGIIGLYPTAHFLKRVEERHIPMPTLAQLKNGELVEVYADLLTLEKLVIRVVKSGKLDFAYVISKQGAIISAWVAPKSNKFDKIDLSVYERG